MDPFTRGQEEIATGILATGGWSNPEEIEDLVAESQSWVSDPSIAAKRDQPLRVYHKGCVFLGETSDKRQLPVGWKDDKHMVTIAGSRAGKGRSAIIPNLYVYSGSVVCVDPKGENAGLTAEWRAKPSRDGGLGQEVYVLDPFRVARVPENLRATFNPLWMVNLKALDALEQISALADSIVVPGEDKDAHWDNSARDLIEALILHVLSWSKYSKTRHLRKVRTLLMNGDIDAIEPTISDQPQASIVFPGDLQEASDFDNQEDVGAFEILLQSMLQNSAFDGAISGQAQNLLNMGIEERGSILSTARRNTKFLDGMAIPRVLQKSNYNLNMKRLKKSPRGATVYLCLPARYMATHSRWLRLVINSLMTEVERAPAKKDLPILAILDEFPILGPMKKLETAIGYMAGFGLKIWTILQDINQIKRDYPKSWETFLGNAGICQYFGNSDRSTLEYISKNLGEVEVWPIIETKTVMDQIQKGHLSDEDLKERLKKKSFLSKLTTEDTDYVQNSFLTGTQVTTAAQVMKTALMTPDEVAREFSRDERRQIISTPDIKPFYLKRVNYDERNAKTYWGKLNRN